MHEGGNLVSVLGWLPVSFSVFGISHKLGPRKRVNELTKAKQSGHWLCFPSGKQMAMRKRGPAVLELWRRAQRTPGLRSKSLREPCCQPALYWVSKCCLLGNTGFCICAFLFITRHYVAVDNLCYKLFMSINCLFYKSLRIHFNVDSICWAFRLLIFQGYLFATLGELRCVLLIHILLSFLSLNI